MGFNAAANAIHKELDTAGVVCAAIGVPKYIDNDILLVSLLKATCDTLCASHTQVHTWLSYCRQTCALFAAYRILLSEGVCGADENSLYKDTRCKDMFD